MYVNVAVLKETAPGDVRRTPTFVAILLTLNLPWTALIHGMWFNVLARVPLTQTNTFSFLVPVFGLTIGILFFGETLGWSHFADIALILIGVRLATTGHGGHEVGHD